VSKSVIEGIGRWAATGLAIDRIFAGQNSCGFLWVVRPSFGFLRRNRCRTRGPSDPPQGEDDLRM
jgi:hypothetical protein